MAGEIDALLDYDLSDVELRVAANTLDYLDPVVQTAIHSMVDDTFRTMLDGTQLDVTQPALGISPIDSVYTSAAPPRARLPNDNQIEVADEDGSWVEDKPVIDKAEYRRRLAASKVVGPRVDWKRKIRITKPE